MGYNNSIPQSFSGKIYKKGVKGNHELTPTSEKI
jgi:hypothetical protein